MELEPSGNDFTIEKSYVYANGQIMMQYDGPQSSASKYFYLHDRLGSVRMIIDENATLQNKYTYEPFGLTADITENVSNPFRFTGQFYDSEIAQYYLRARMYDLTLLTFTARDPVLGRFQEPLTLHAYLYCLSDPINGVDPTGERTLKETLAAMGATASMWAHQAGDFLRRSFFWARNVIQGINLSTRLRNAWIYTSDKAGQAWQRTRDMIRVQLVKRATVRSYKYISYDALPLL